MSVRVPYAAVLPIARLVYTPEILKQSRASQPQPEGTAAEMPAYLWRSTIAGPAHGVELGAVAVVGGDTEGRTHAARGREQLRLIFGRDGIPGIRPRAHSDADTECVEIVEGGLIAQVVDAESDRLIDPDGNPFYEVSSADGTTTIRVRDLPPGVASFRSTSSRSMS